MSRAITERRPARAKAGRDRSLPLLCGFDQSKGLARLKELLRVLRDAVDEDFVMYVRAGGTAGRAQEADPRLARQLLPDIDGDLVQMGVFRVDAHAMVYLDLLAIGGGIAGKNHRAGRGVVDRRAI